MRRGPPLFVILLAGVALCLAAAGILYESGVKSAFLDRYNLRWRTSSGDLAIVAYGTFLSGKTAEGLALFELALRRDPASPFRWCDYGEALLASGDTARARKCMLRGLELGPSNGPILMRGVNFAYRTDDSAAALRYGKSLLALVPDYDGSVFSVWKGMDLPIGSVLDRGLAGRRAAQSFMRYLIAGQSMMAAGRAWPWMERSGFADDRLADDYVAFLVRSNEPEQAALAWALYAGRREPSYPASNAVFNGSFEREPTGCVFDWKITPVDGAGAGRDSAVSVWGRYSLRIGFDGTENVAYSHVSQTVPVRAGRYRFEAHLRTADITTDEGVGFRVFDPQDPRRVDVKTERLTGTHDWTRVGADVLVPPASKLLEIQVIRLPSLKFDNKIGGAAWIDAVSLQRQ